MSNEIKDNHYTKTFISMITFGLLMGQIFPVYANIFTVFKEGMKIYFDIGCLMAGLTVGIVAFL